MPRIYFFGSPRLATPACSSMDLYSAILAVGPGLVFEELESEEGRPAGPEGLSIEQEAVSAYAATRECLRLPYDMPGWGEAARGIGYLEGEREFFGKLKAMANAGTLARADVSALAAAESSRRAYEEVFSLSLSALNRPAFAARLEAAEEARLALAVSACARYPALSGYTAHFSSVRALLARRRKAMAERILAALGRHRSDAVVISGAAEKGRLERAVAGTAARMGYAVDSLWKY